MKSSFNGLVADVPIPKMIKIRQVFPRPKIEDMPHVLLQELNRAEIAGAIRPGMRIAVTAGSRGISQIAPLLRELCTFLKQKGAEPFIFPAMGSHGGATAEGQREVLESLGITKEYCGAPIISSMETLQIGFTENGRPVYIDRAASEADATVVVNRVKLHTDLKKKYQSGLMKMMVIGMGKQYGAELCHSSGMEMMEEFVPLYGNAILKNGNVIFGIGLVENAYDELCEIRAIPNADIPTVELEMLAQAKALFGRIYLDRDIDLLIVDKIGKNISGCGMDPNITGRWPTTPGEGGINAARTLVLDLNEETHGAFVGLGLADMTTRRCVNKCIPEATYPNALTSCVFKSSKIPLTMENDKEAIQACLKFCGTPTIDVNHPRVVRIGSTAELEEIWISEALLDEAMACPNVEVLSDPVELVFNKEDNLW